MSDSARLAIFSQTSCTRQDLPAGPNQSCESPIFQDFPTHTTSKKERLCSFSTASSEGQSPTTNVLDSPQSAFPSLANRQVFKHGFSAQLRSVLSILLPKLPNGPPSDKTISDFFVPESQSQAEADEDREELVPRGIEDYPVQNSIPLVSFLPANNCSVSAGICQAEVDSIHSQLDTVVTLFDCVAAKELTGACPQVQKKVQEVIAVVAKFVNWIQETLKTDTPNQVQPGSTRGAFGFGHILKIPSIFKRALSCEESKPSPNFQQPRSYFCDLGYTPRVHLVFTESPLVHLRDAKDKNIFDGSPRFARSKIPNYSPEATTKIQASRTARGMFSIILPLQLLDEEFIAKQFKIYEAAPSLYFSKFSCPSLVEIESKLSVPVGLFGLKDHTQQLSVWLASLALLEQLLELMLSTLPEQIASNHMRFCRHYFKASLQQTRDYRRTGLSLHLNLVGSRLTPEPLLSSKSNAGNEES